MYEFKWEINTIPGTLALVAVVVVFCLGLLKVAELLLIR